MFRGVVAIVFGVLTLGLIASGCGGGDSDSITRAEYTKQGNAICAKGIRTKDKRLVAVFEEHSKEAELFNKQGLQEQLLANVALPPMRAMQQELAELDMPSGDEKEVEAFVAALDTALSKAEADPNLALKHAVDLFEETHKLAASYGLKACARI